MERIGQRETGRPEATMPFVPVEIASHRCKGCRLCTVACPQGALALDEGVVNAIGYHPVYLVDGAACTSCALCSRVCPEGAFTVYVQLRRTR
jgi:2-oxoglutarate ferredoxin oxidoreductase subunit delta